MFRTIHSITLGTWLAWTLVHAQAQIPAVGSTSAGTSNATNAIPTAEQPTRPAPGLVLRATAQVDRQGVFAAQLGTLADGSPLPEVRLLDAPLPGTSLQLSRAKLAELFQRARLPIPATNWTGADQIVVSRRTRSLEADEVLQLLTKALQARCVRDRGELELRFGRPWNPVQVPDEPLTIRILDLPASGIGPLVLTRFELLSGTEPAGTWQAVLQARVWGEIWIARSALRRGQPIAETDLARERRDLLTLRETLADPTANDHALQAAENVAAGAPLLQRHLRLQPVVFRGQTITVLVEEGPLNLAMKAEVLEDGAPGQIVRLRNLNSRRELRGKVRNEKIIVPVL